MSVFTIPRAPDANYLLVLLNTHRGSLLHFLSPGLLPKMEGIIICGHCTCMASLRRVASILRVEVSAGAQSFSRMHIVLLITRYLVRVCVCVCVCPLLCQLVTAHASVDMC